MSYQLSEGQYPQSVYYLVLRDQGPGDRVFCSLQIRVEIVVSDDCGPRPEQKSWP